jgi:hypothetical protein
MCGAPERSTAFGALTFLVLSQLIMDQKVKFVRGNTVFAMFFRHKSKCKTISQFAGGLFGTVKQGKFGQGAKFGQNWMLS